MLWYLVPGTRVPGTLVPVPDTTEVGVWRVATYDKFYTLVYGKTESRISLDVMHDVENEHHIFGGYTSTGTGI